MTMRTDLRPWTNWPPAPTTNNANISLIFRHTEYTIHRQKKLGYDIGFNDNATQAGQLMVDEHLQQK
jgi:hypothetical protein